MRVYPILPAGAAAIAPRSVTQPGMPGLRVASFPVLFAGEQLRIMSYNVRNFFDTVPDPQTPPGAQRQVKGQKSIQALARVILKESPDIIALQEVEGEQVLKKFNTNHLKGQYPNIVIFPTNDQRGIRVAFMSKPHLTPVSTASHRHEQANGSKVFSRDLLESTYKTAAGYSFTLFTSHFKSMRGGEQQTMPIRLQEARTAAQIIDRKIKQDPKAKIILLGDLNTLHSQYGLPVLKAVAGKEDQDPNNDLTEVLEKGGKVASTYRGGRRHASSKLDYIYASNAMLTDVKRSFVIGRFTQWPWQVASDHLPVMTVIEAPDPPKPVKLSARRQPGFSQPKPAKLSVFA